MDKFFSELRYSRQKTTWGNEFNFPFSPLEDDKVDKLGQ